MKKPLKIVITVKRVAPRHWKTELEVGVQGFVLMDKENSVSARIECDMMRNYAKQIIGFVQKGDPWEVKVDRWQQAPGKPFFYRARLIVNAFDLNLATYEETADDPDGPQGGPQHCRFIALMFKKALANAGIAPKRAKTTAAGCKKAGKKLSTELKAKAIQAAVGVGVSADGLRPVIYLYLRYKKDIPKVPVTFEGYAVRTVVTGQVKPL